jgi:hypothetical protein
MMRYFQIIMFFAFFWFAYKQFSQWLFKLYCRLWKYGTKNTRRATSISFICPIRNTPYNDRTELHGTAVNAIIN